MRKICTCVVGAVVDTNVAVRVLIDEPLVLTIEGGGKASLCRKVFDLFENTTAASSDVFFNDLGRSSGGSKTAELENGHEVNRGRPDQHYLPLIVEEDTVFSIYTTSKMTVCHVINVKLAVNRADQRNVKVGASFHHTINTDLEFVNQAALAIENYSMKTYDLSSLLIFSLLTAS